MKPLIDSDYPSGLPSVRYEEGKQKIFLYSKQGLVIKTNFINSKGRFTGEEMSQDKFGNILTKKYFLEGSKTEGVIESYDWLDQVKEKNYFVLSQGGLIERIYQDEKKAVLLKELHRNRSDNAIRRETGFYPSKRKSHTIRFVGNLAHGITSQFNDDSENTLSIRHNAKYGQLKTSVFYGENKSKLQMHGWSDPSKGTMTQLIFPYSARNRSYVVNYENFNRKNGISLETSYLQDIHYDEFGREGKIRTFCFDANKTLTHTIHYDAQKWDENGNMLSGPTKMFEANGDLTVSADFLRDQDNLFRTGLVLFKDNTKTHKYGDHLTMVEKGQEISRCMYPVTHDENGELCAYCNLYGDDEIAEKPESVPSPN